MVAICCIAFLLLFALYSDQTLPAVSYAVNQFLFTVLPSLLPFYVASEVLMRTGFCQKLGKVCRPIMKPLFGIAGEGAFAVIIGMVSGYPAGAKVTADLYRTSLITKEDARKLSVFTNNTGPLFLIGAVGAGMLHSAKAGIALWICHILASLLTGFLLSFPHQKGRSIPTSHGSSGRNVTEPTKKFGQILSESMTASTYTMLPIAGAILFFAALTAVFTQSGIIPLFVRLFHYIGLGQVASGVLPGILEITGGISILSSLKITKAMQLTAIAFVSGWAGISVHIQVIGILSAAGLSSRSYLWGKLLHALLAANITLAAFLLFPQWFF